MILACKAYLTEDGKLSIWNESKAVMISKIKVKDIRYKEYKIDRNRINVCVFA